MSCMTLSLRGRIGITTQLQMVENDVLFSSDARCFLRSHSGINRMAVGRWYSREFNTQIKTETMSRLSDEDYARVPSAIFSTASGAIGVIASLPSEVYLYLENFEEKMRIERKSDADFIEVMHECIGLKDAQVKHFIDGDFLEEFLTLSTERQQRIANNMSVQVGTLKSIVLYLTLFH